MIPITTGKCKEQAKETCSLTTITSSEYSKNQGHNRNSASRMFFFFVQVSYYLMMREGIALLPCQPQEENRPCMAL